MTDVVDRATRSRMMSGIGGKNTKPELVLRRALHSRGLRYRLHDRKLPELRTFLSVASGPCASYTDASGTVTKIVPMQLFPLPDLSSGRPNSGKCRTGWSDAAAIATGRLASGNRLGMRVTKRTGGHHGTCAGAVATRYETRIRDNPRMGRQEPVRRTLPVLTSSRGHPSEL